MIYTRSMVTGVVVLIGTAAVQAQDEGSEPPLREDLQRQAEARNAESEERFRLAIARLVLYQKSGVRGEGSDLLRELFARTRQVLRQVHENASVSEVEESTVIDLLLRGRDGMDPGAEVDEDQAERIEELPWELARRSRMSVTFHGSALKQFATTLSKVSGRLSRFRVAPEVEEVRVSLRAEGTNYRELLDLVTEQSGITYGVRGGVVVFVAPDKRPQSLEQVHRFAWETITALGILGSEAEAATEVLERMASVEDRQIVARAKAALRQIRR